MGLERVFLQAGCPSLSAHRQTHTHRHTKVKTVYPPVSLRSLGGYNNATKYGVRRNHTVRSTHGCRLSTCIFAVSCDRLTKSSYDMSTKTARILVLVSVIWSNFRHSFSCVDEN